MESYSSPFNAFYNFFPAHIFPLPLIWIILRNTFPSSRPHSHLMDSLAWRLKASGKWNFCRIITLRINFRLHWAPCEHFPEPFVSFLCLGGFFTSKGGLSSIRQIELNFHKKYMIRWREAKHFSERKVTSLLFRFLLIDIIGIESKSFVLSRAQCLWLGKGRRICDMTTNPLRSSTIWFVKIWFRSSWKISTHSCEYREIFLLSSSYKNPFP